MGRRPCCNLSAIPKINFTGVLSKNQKNIIHVRYTSDRLWIDFTLIDCIPWSVTRSLRCHSLIKIFRWPFALPSLSFFNWKRQYAHFPSHCTNLFKCSLKWKSSLLSKYLIYLGNWWNYFLFKLVLGLLSFLLYQMLWCYYTAFIGFYFIYIDMSWAISPQDKF